VVVVATWLRERAPAAASYFGLSELTDGDLDKRSTMFAPIGVSLIGCSALLRSSPDSRYAIYASELDRRLRPSFDDRLTRSGL